MAFDSFGVFESKHKPKSIEFFKFKTEIVHNQTKQIRDLVRF